MSKKLELMGWVPYPPGLVNGRLNEDLNVIADLLGSVLYEWCVKESLVYIRRID